MLDDAKVREQVQIAESLLDKLENLQDEQAQLIAVNAVQALITLYGEALARIVAHARRDQEEGGQSTLLPALAADELVSHLLLLHDLHPVPLQNRVQQALDELEGYLQSRDVTAELLHIRDGVATIRLGSAAGRKQQSAVQSAVMQAAPELLRVQLENGAHNRRPGASSFIPLNTLAPAKESQNNG